jgi:hypothetical protein
MEKDSWVAWQGHDGKFFQDFLSDDHIEVGVGGPSGKKGVVDGVASGVCIVAAYKLDHFAFHQLGPDTAVLTYWADQTTRCGASVVPSPVWATSVYQRRGGRWVNVVYVHTPAAKAGGQKKSALRRPAVSDRQP